MVLALLVPVLMLALLIGMDVFEERLFGAKPSPPTRLPNPEITDCTTRAIPEQPPHRRPG